MDAFQIEKVQIISPPLANAWKLTASSQRWTASVIVAGRGADRRGGAVRVGGKSEGAEPMERRERATAGEAIAIERSATRQEVHNYFKYVASG